jgi:hypothetical protein
VRFGSTVDAGHGRVRLITARDAVGHLQSGVFDGGAFVVAQERSGLTDLLLARGHRRRAVCGARPGAASGRAPRVSSSVLRLLHARVHGRFRTIGRYAAGTVRGTTWTTADRCTGTAIIDHRGNVESATRGAPLSFSLAPGYSVEYRCALQGLAPVSTGYCVALLSQDTTTVVSGRRVRFVAYAAGLITKSSADHTDVCVRGPARSACTPYPLAPPDRFGFRESIVGCTPDQGAGDYAVSWRVNGVALGTPLTYHAPIRALVHLPCRAWLGQPSIGPSLASFGADLKRVNRYSLPTNATSTDLRVYLAPSGTAGQQLIRGLVYADSDGTPGALLAVSDELAFRSTDSPGWYDLKLPSRLNLSAGDYWLGVITGAQTRVAAFAYANVPGSRDYNVNPYINGPSDPFGPISTDSAEMSLYLVYDIPPP